MTDQPHIGIDFGTSNSAVCRWNPLTNAPEVIRNEHGEEKTPSVVYRGPNETLVGKPALDQLADVAHMEEDERLDVLRRTFMSVKRLLKDNLPLALPDGETVTPVELASDILYALKQSAEQGCFNGERVTKATITHPVSFGKKQIANLKEAAALAAFDEIGLMEEPVAAIHGYVASGAKTGKGILVFDFGGGTLDLAYLLMEGDGQYHMPVAPIGEDLGGDDFDRLVYDHFERELKQKHGVGFSLNGVLNLAVLNQCRLAKEKLSSQGKARHSYLMPESNVSVRFELDRAGLESLIKNDVLKAGQLAQRMIEQVGEAGHEVDSVILIGGATRMPVILETLKASLPVKPMATMHADVAVAMGAGNTSSSDEKDYAFEALAAPEIIPFGEALVKGDITAARWHLRRGTDINTQLSVLNDAKIPPLAVAAQYGHLDLCRLLISQGADPLAMCASGMSALHFGIWHKKSEVADLMIRALKDAKAELNPLSLAVIMGDFQQVRHHTTDDALLNHADCFGMTPLMWAALSENEEVLQLIISAGADVRLQTPMGNSALHFAARTESLLCTSALLDAESELNGCDVFGCTPLFRACQYNRIDISSLLLNAGADLRAKTKRDWTPLDLAARKGHTKVVGLLLDAGAYLEAVTEGFCTPLHWAAIEGHAEVIQVLLDAGADLEATDWLDYTPLHWAAHKGRADIVQVLLDAGADIEARNWFGHDWTPLHCAVIKGHLSVVKLMMEQGADILAPTKGKKTLLHLAAEAGHATVADLLIKAGADLDAKDSNYRTPLRCAADKGHAEVVQLLLDAGAVLDAGTDLDSKDRNYGTPLHCAADNGYAEEVQTLLDAGADLDAKTKCGWTPLHCAADAGHAEVVQVLLDAGADLQAKDAGGSNPLHGAAWGGHAEVVQVLLDAGADLEAKGVEHSTPLHCAADNGHVGVVQILLDAGADFEAKKVYDFTPLHCAVREGHAGVVQVLLEAGANLEAIDWKCRTPLHCAADAGHAEVVRILLDAGADLQAEDEGDLTPLDLAIHKGHAELVQVLLDVRSNFSY